MSDLVKIFTRKWLNRQSDRATLFITQTQHTEAIGTMNSIFSRQLSLSLALLAPIATGVAVFGSGLSAQAQTMTL
ncbi:MAG: hypothetical protein CLLPBCKN_000334 [Chroococcidiopsis cubana SAG 39.79]|jgi:hypothetical protein|uniref:Uncharacterized protein n=2 Tax=Chroococcidiopsis TaxID=54298 RepID=K9U3A9_CHRTP|nr:MULTISPECIES: hypothetical protein [Chroococcidiopsis]PSB44480.1 hypothetical protein C7B80_20415 [Cyanosarcina cf. burmensis CCALA 770]AFY89280.1 hypothetical protein Chro_3858 [Chroococcidiopsis thermalis PCC 7203]MDZ4870946.1 hypothetical protein [Chroococcidiopsis cubana SAG 39.79]PSB64541.1 hypothetical protein C7B79_09320 [Chroococcidiopsis cubana CCALA 043]RUT10390.1 hypothetical protein DSM107010_42780 [Chroococcidiopsis cubana SAG 39.79]